MLWENKYKKSYSMICDLFLAHFISSSFTKNVLGYQNKQRKSIAYRNWYIEEKYTYIRILGANGSPHLLPTYVPDKVVLGEICYQTILQGSMLPWSKTKREFLFPMDFNLDITSLRILCRPGKRV
jgi:hypothetical protein